MTEKYFFSQPKTMVMITSISKFNSLSTQSKPTELATQDIFDDYEQQTIDESSLPPNEWEEESDESEYVASDEMTLLSDTGDEEDEDIVFVRKCHGC